jgi:hypothetical protein
VTRRVSRAKKQAHSTEPHAGLGEQASQSGRARRASRRAPQLACAEHTIDADGMRALVELFRLLDTWQTDLDNATKRSKE